MYHIPVRLPMGHQTRAVNERRQPGWRRKQPIPQEFEALGNSVAQQVMAAGQFSPAKAQRNMRAWSSGGYCNSVL